MARRIDVGRVFGIPIDLDASWFIILALVSWTLARQYFPDQLPGLSVATYWLMGMAAAVLLFGCVLLHELGHSVVAKRSGIPVARVTLFIFGGVAQIADDPKRPGVELRVALAGPLVSLAIALGCFWLSRGAAPKTVGQAVALVMVRYLAMVNAALLAFNLLPGFPLDGGRVVRAALWAWLRDLRKATRIASLLGSALGFGLLVLGLASIARGRWLSGIWDIVLGTFLRNAAQMSYYHVLLRQSLEGGRN